MMNEKVKALALRSAVGVGTAMAAIPGIALAEGETTSTVESGLTGLATSVATDGISAINAILPVVAPLLAAVIVIGIGIKTIKKVAGRG